MIFGTQIGVAPGSLAMRLNGTMPQGPGVCPPDPVWRYFPSPFEPLTYFNPQPPAPQLQPPVISIEPPMRPGWDPIPDPKTTLPPELPRPPGPAMTPVGPSPGRGDPMVPGPAMTPGSMPPQMPAGMVPHAGVFVPYGREARLAGPLGQPGPFGMTWGGFLGVLGAAVAGGVGLGYLYHRRS